MRYVSTRGTASVLGFEDVLLAGLARDGGLYVPEEWPRLSAGDFKALAPLSYPALAARIMAPFTAGCLDEDALATLCADAYADFGHPAVAPLKQLDDGLWMMELFHGPTLAFKDYALQIVGRLFDHVLGKRGRRMTVLGATSGDTGSAAIEALRGRDAVDVFILHPEGRVSEVQRRQMTTVDAPNIHNIAVEGTFDDCQDLVKALFNDHAFRDEVGLGAVNSINWARVLGQIVYYVRAALALGAPDRDVAFAVPTGNFGNIFAGYGAREMGLPIPRLICASNRNDILARFLEGGSLEARAVEPSLSPSMDIQISSNFERLLFDAYDRDGQALDADMTAFRRDGRLSVERSRWHRIRELFAGFRLDDAGTRAEIARLYAETGELVDPHSAIGIAAARAGTEGLACPVVCLATAHPAKFPDAVEKATGRRPALPGRLADLYDRPERVERLANDADALRARIRDMVAK